MYVCMAFGRTFCLSFFIQARPCIVLRLCIALAVLIAHVAFFCLFFGLNIVFSFGCMTLFSWGEEDTAMLDFQFI